jgi:hypothetical protein
MVFFALLFTLLTFFSATKSFGAAAQKDASQQNAVTSEEEAVWRLALMEGAIDPATIKTTFLIGERLRGVIEQSTIIPVNLEQLVLRATAL